MLLLQVQCAHGSLRSDRFHGPPEALPTGAPHGTDAHGTVRAPAAAARAQLDGDGAGQLTRGEDAALARRLHQLDALAAELGRQRAAHGLVGEGRAVPRQAGSLVKIQHFLSARKVEQK